MRVQIETVAFFGKGKERKKYGAGSIVEIDADTYELNKSWMKATDDKEKFVKPPADDAEPEEAKKNEKDK
jgi:hypothetical protein